MLAASSARGVVDAAGRAAGGGGCSAGTGAGALFLAVVSVTAGIAGSVGGGSMRAVLSTAGTGAGGGVRSAIGGAAGSAGRVSPVDEDPNAEEEGDEAGDEERAVVTGGVDVRSRSGVASEPRCGAAALTDEVSGSLFVRAGGTCCTVAVEGIRALGSDPTDAGAAGGVVGVGAGVRAAAGRSGTLDVPTGSSDGRLTSVNRRSCSGRDK
jgi:hypothetical protein